MNMAENWITYDDKNNVPQKSYDDLLHCGSTRELTDDEAVALVCEEFGFDKEKVTVVRTVGKYEIDTNSRRLRLVGETERKPLYNATDFNYVRFDCAGWFYEMYDGELRKYYC